MRIEPRDTIANVPILRIRDLMRQMHSVCSSFSESNIGAMLDIPHDQAKAVTAELLQHGYLRADADVEHRGIEYRVTESGVRLAAARANKPLKRATAERLLAEFLGRIEPINQDDYYLYQISRVVLFGSYLGGSPTLGDIDLIVHIEPKEPNPDVHRELCIERNLEHLERGWSLGFIDLYAAYETLSWREVFVALRKRSAYLSLHPAHDEVVIENEPHQVIYGNADWVVPVEMRVLWGVPGDA